MATNLYQYLQDKDVQKNMPHITIKKRPTDKQISFNPKKNRIDRIAGDVYGDETLGRIILWANPEIDYEFDLEAGTLLRIPYPINDVIQEVVAQIEKKKNT